MSIWDVYILSNVFFQANRQKAHLNSAEQTQNRSDSKFMDQLLAIETKANRLRAEAQKLQQQVNSWNDKVGVLTDRTSSRLHAIESVIEVYSQVVTALSKQV